MNIKKFEEFENIVPDSIIDSFYERIKSKLEIGHDKNSTTIKKELDRILAINGTIPEKIQNLLRN